MPSPVRKGGTHIKRDCLVRERGGWSVRRNFICNPTASQVKFSIETVDVAIVIGANDVVNPAAREMESSPIYGMPVINVDHARTVFVLKRSMASGFAGIENPLFYKDNTRMLFGDAKESIGGLVREFGS